MKFFIVCFIVGSLIAEGLSAPVENAEETNVEHINERKATAEVENVDGVRFRKAAYGAPLAKAPGHGVPTTYTYPSAAPTVPCGKNLLFSCQPSVAPVPCYAPAPAYPSYPAPAPAPYAGAYSEPIAQWAYHPTINQLW